MSTSISATLSHPSALIPPVIRGYGPIDEGELGFTLAPLARTAAVALRTEDGDVLAWRSDGSGDAPGWPQTWVPAQQLPKLLHAKATEPGPSPLPGSWAVTATLHGEAIELEFTRKMGRRGVLEVFSDGEGAWAWRFEPGRAGGALQAGDGVPFLAAAMRQGALAALGLADDALEDVA
ncbi:MAG: hypothetical protein H6739_34650 [Alphaproteobacteria bacterium]|nr:hypothetical protein [Alphaproteobacteria bacterium]